MSASVMWLTCDRRCSHLRRYKTLWLSRRCCSSQTQSRPNYVFSVLLPQWHPTRSATVVSNMFLFACYSNKYASDLVKLCFSQHYLLPLSMLIMATYTNYTSSASCHLTNQAFLQTCVTSKFSLHLCHNETCLRPDSIHRTM